MPRIVRTNDITTIAQAIIKQLTEPTRFSVDNIEYTIKPDCIYVYGYVDQAAIAVAVRNMSPEIIRPIISVADHAYAKFLMSPASIIDEESPYTYSIVELRFSDCPHRAIRTSCGVFIDTFNVIKPLNKNDVIKSLIDGRDMIINETDLALEMTATDMISYFNGVEGIAKYNGDFARIITNNIDYKHFIIDLDKQNEFMFISIWSIRNTPALGTEVYTCDKFYGIYTDECQCKFKFGPLYAVYGKLEHSRDRYVINCSACVRSKGVVAEVQTDRTLQDAVREYIKSLDDTPQDNERAEITKDLIGGELIRWRGKLCLRGKKWFYCPNLLWALYNGIAIDYPGYYWI